MYSAFFTEQYCEFSDILLDILFLIFFYNMILNRSINAHKFPTFLYLCGFMIQELPRVSRHMLLLHILDLKILEVGN